MLVLTPPPVLGRLAALLILGSAATAQASNLSEVASVQPIRDAVTAEYKISLKRESKDPAASITSASNALTYVESGQDSEARGKLYVSSAGVWTAERQGRDTWDSIVAVLDGRLVRFTHDPKRTRLVEDSGVADEEGGVDLFAGEGLGYVMFGKGPLGSGFTYRDLFQSYTKVKRTEFPTFVQYEATGPSPYIARIRTSQDGRRLIEVHLQSIEPTYRFERTVRFTTWQRVGGREVGTAGTYRLSQGVLGSGGEGPSEVVSGTFELGRLARASQAVPLPVSPNLVLAEPGPIGQPQKRYRIEGGKLVPTAAALSPMRSSSAFPWPLALGAAAVVGAAVVVWRRRSGRRA